MSCFVWFPVGVSCGLGGLADTFLGHVRISHFDSNMDGQRSVAIFGASDYLEY